MVEVGFLASALGDVPNAEVIFAALTELEPSKAAPYLGLGLAYLNARRAQDAVDVLEKGASMVDAEDLPELQAVRALALQLAGRSAESQRLLSQYPASTLSQAMRGLPETSGQKLEI